MYSSASNHTRPGLCGTTKQGQAIRLVVAGMAMLLTAVAVADAGPEPLEPADARGIRIIGGQGPMLLGFMAIKKTATPLEDRTVIEFDISGLSPDFESATLDLGLSNLDPGPPQTMIGIFDYEGDGVVTAEEFYAGVFFRDFEFDNPPRVINVDVTESVRDAMRSGWHYLGFRLSTEGPDRFWVGSIVGLPDPMMTVYMPDCTGKEFLKSKCRRGKVKATLKKAMPNIDVVATLDGGQGQQKNTGDKGKVRFKWKHVPSGPHTVAVDPCDVRGEAICP